MAIEELMGLVRKLREAEARTTRARKAAMVAYEALAEARECSVGPTAEAYELLLEHYGALGKDLAAAEAEERSADSALYAYESAERDRQFRIASVMLDNPGFDYETAQVFVALEGTATDEEPEHRMNEKLRKMVAMQYLPLHGSEVVRFHLEEGK